MDFRADIYGLGATFYHMVTGQVPFDGANPSAVMHKHLKAELVPPDHINPALSAGVSEIIEVCMAKDRKQRYASTADLVQDLETVARGEPPLQARRKFDLSSLAGLEGGAAAETTITKVTVNEGGFAGLVQQPIFWVAVAGWAVAVILLIVVIVVR